MRPQIEVYCTATASVRRCVRSNPTGGDIDGSSSAARGAQLRHSSNARKVSASSRVCNKATCLNLQTAVRAHYEGSTTAWGVLQSLSTSLQRVQRMLHSLYSNRCAPSLHALKLKCNAKLRNQRKAACAQTRRQTGAALTFIAGAALQFQRRLLHYCLQYTCAHNIRHHR